MKRGSRYVIGTTLGQAYIQHIMSIYSAYIGSRWQTGGKLLRIAAMICLLLMVGVEKALGDVITLTYSDISATSYSSSEATFTNGATFGYVYTMRNNANGTPEGWASGQLIQMKKSSDNGQIYNKTAISTISNIRVYIVVNTNSFTLSYGTTTACNAGSISRPTTATGTESITYSSYSKPTVTPGQTTTATYYDFDLSSSSPTYFKITNGSGALYVWKIVITYSAASCTTNATVTAGSNSSVTKNSARVTCSSGISSLGSAGCSITSYGFVLGTSSNPTTSNTTYEVGTSYTSTGVSFYKDLTELSAGTTYYVRPYATNGNGTAYGTQTTFTTLFEASITLDKNGGSANGSAKAVENATSLSSISAPTRTGYTLEGYYTTSGCATKIATSAGAFQPSITVSSNTWTNGSSQWKRNASETFYAKWTANTYSVVFNKNNNDATGTMSNESFTYGESKALTACAFSLVGYTFAGWATTSGGSVAYSDGQSVSNLTATNGGTFNLYAKWNAKSFSVTWMVNGSEWSGKGGSTSVNFGSRISTLPTAPTTSDGCGDKFVGWTTVADYVHGTSPLFTTAGTAPLISAEGNVTYYAVFADYDE